jgi:outer membrane protein assembly factor BamB
VVQTREKMVGVNITDGNVLWEQPVKAFRGMNILTPVVHGDLLFTSTYGGKTIGFKVDLVDGEFAVEEVWRHKAQGYMSTPVIIDGIAYEHLKSQRMMAIDVVSGEEQWTSDQSFGKYMSLVASNDRILALDQRGELLLLQANREKLTIFDRRQLTEAETWAHLAVAGDEIFVRELNGLVAYRWIPEATFMQQRTEVLADRSLRATGFRNVVGLIDGCRYVFLRLPRVVSIRPVNGMLRLKSRHGILQVGCLARSGPGCMR